MHTGRPHPVDPPSPGSACGVTGSARARRCADLQRLADRAAAEGRAQRELADAAQRELRDRLAAAQAAAGESVPVVSALREELRAREAELTAVREGQADAERESAARAAESAAAHAAHVASLEEAHAARVAALESGRRILLQGGDDKARLKEELLRLHQELYSTQVARTLAAACRCCCPARARLLAARRAPRGPDTPRSHPP